MTDEQIRQAIVTIFTSGTTGLVAVGVVKWAVNKWLETQREIRRLELKQATDMAKENKEAIGRVQDLQVTLRAEFSSMKDRIDMIIPVLNRNSERFVELSTAFKGYVKNTNERLEKVEHSTAEVIKVGREIATRVGNKKPQGGG